MKKSFGAVAEKNPLAAQQRGKVCDGLVASILSALDCAFGMDK